MKLSSAFGFLFFVQWVKVQVFTADLTHDIDTGDGKHSSQHYSNANEQEQVEIRHACRGNSDGQLQWFA